MEAKRCMDSLQPQPMMLNHRKYSATPHHPGIRIPYEIICRIFLECRNIDVWAPKIISQVCHSWRQIALAHHELWTHIDLRPEKYSLDRASAWAERAGTLAINVGIRWLRIIDNESILAWLRNEAGRIKSLYVLHIGPGAENALLPSLPRLPCMESFQIVGLDDIDLDMRWMAQIMSTSPHLSTLSLSGVGGLHFPESVQGVGTRLTHLSIGARSHIDYAFPLRVDAVLDVLSACTGLVALECHALAEEDDQEPQVVFLPCLTSLAIGDGPETCLILHFLRVPYLHTFSLVRGKVLNEKEEEIEIPEMDLDHDGYVDLLVDCIWGLHKICSPPVTRVIWHRSIVSVDVLILLALFLKGMEELECYELGEEISLNFLGLGTRTADCLYPSLRRISFIKCKVSPELLVAIQTAIEDKDPARSPPIAQVIVEDCPGSEDIYFGTQ